MEIVRDILIIVFGLISVGGAIAVLTRRDPLHAALGLLVSMISIGFIYLVIGARFVGFVQMIIYAGAIAILFLFGVMNFPIGKLRRDRIPLTALIGSILIAVLTVLLFVNFNAVMHAKVGGIKLSGANPPDALEIGRHFLSDWIYPFELTSVLLLAAIVCAVHLTRKPEKSDDEEDKK